MDHALVAGVVQVDEVRFPFGWKSGSIDGVPMILRSDVAATRGEVQSGYIVRTITILQLHGTCPRGKCEKLMSQADTKDRHLRGLHDPAKVIHRFLAVCWIAWAIGKEQSVKVMNHTMNWKIVWENSDRCISADKTAQYVFFDTAVTHGNMSDGIGSTDMERLFGANPADKINLLRIDI